MKKDHRSPENISWTKMKSRCNGTSSEIDNRRYHQRGIKYDKRWEKFSEFLKDMGKRPSKNHSLGRINNELGYCKENCRWETRKQQMRNTSRNVYYEINGEKMTMSEVADMLGISRKTLWRRVRVQNLTIEQAINFKRIKFGNGYKKDA